MLVLAAGQTAAVAQDGAIGSSSTSDQTLPDPVPVARPLYSPSAATSGSALESPAAGVDARTTSATRQDHLLACSVVSPCATVSPARAS
jgi:hypothetical protein